MNIILFALCLVISHLSYAGLFTLKHRDRHYNIAMSIYVVIFIAGLVGTVTLFVTTGPLR